MPRTPSLDRQSLPRTCAVSQSQGVAAGTCGGDVAPNWLRIARNDRTQIIHVWYIYLQNWVIYGVNVGKYSIHGSSGNWLRNLGMTVYHWMLFLGTMSGKSMLLSLWFCFVSPIPTYLRKAADRRVQQPTLLILYRVYGIYGFNWFDCRRCLLG